MKIHIHEIIHYRIVTAKHQKQPACMRAKLLLTSPTLCNPMDYSPPRYSVQGIVQARTLEWVAISSSRGRWMTSWQVGLYCYEQVSNMICLRRVRVCQNFLPLPNLRTISGLLTHVYLQKYYFNLRSSQMDTGQIKNQFIQCK